MRARASGLDLIRVSAAFAVYLGHLGNHNGPYFGAISDNGGLGVLGFFALSGYLVYRPFLWRDVPTMEHLSRRLIRIVPAWVVAAVVLSIVVTPEAAHWLTVVSWSLLVELGFYGLLPLIARLAVGRERRVLLGLGAASLAVSIATSLLDIPYVTKALLVPSYLWAFVPGMCLALAERHGSQLVGDRRMLPLGLVLVVLAYGAGAAGLANPILPGVLASTGATSLMAGSLGWDPAGARLMALAADMSYPFYLWHASIVTSLSAAMAGPALMAGSLLVSCAASLASVTIVERPLRRGWAALLDRRRRAAAEALAALASSPAEAA